MKLLTKTSLHYLWVSGVLLLASCFLWFVLLKRDISAEIKEQLELEAELVIHEIKEGNPINFPLVKIEQGQNNAVKIFKDTVIFDPLQQKNEDYYLLTQSRIINNRPYRITVTTAHIGWAEYFKAIMYMFVILVSLLICGGVGVNYLISKNIWRPFLKNMAILKGFSLAKNQDLALVKSDINEFEELNAVMTDFVTQARREYKSLQEFSENASHELQTPISIIRARLESISQLPLDTKAASYLVDAKQSLDRLSKVNKGLLLLAKLEHDNFPDLQRISLSVTVTDIIDQFEELFNSKRLHLKHDIQPVTINASPHLVNIMVSNLLSNMRNHTEPGKFVAVALSPDKLMFVNEGKLLTFSEDALFTRFKNKDAASTGIGLGLSIIKQICLVHGWVINYGYSNGRHHFTVFLKNVI
ncbi:Signal transduction histidine kinase [Mucilaginibacter pineti]|uniref:histidine kinase n=1 Tax=Mucilaginibacter pineti TaxID=1391627 RepID=A0A1G6UDK6_9SPHI|nr:HAMP domain-containing sensor histidine kinase [Mucilaginibacter pineti]SDD38756.1 Signal transduction histidine kinase [Mucilaginibacter pineti]